MASQEGDGGKSYFEARATRLLDDVAERLWRSLPVFLALCAAFFLLTGFYHVGQGELGVVRTLGKVTGQALPGLRFRVPGVQTVELVEVAATRRLRIGSFDAGDGEALLLSGDGKLCAVDATIAYRVTDAEKYTSRVANPEQASRALSEVALSKAIGAASSEQLFGPEHGSVERDLHNTLQTLLDDAQSGMQVTEVRLMDVAQPADVKKALADVHRAYDERDRLVASATSERAKALAHAQSEAALLQGAANAYASERVLRAKADAERFEILQAEYARAPDVTRRRLQLETAGRVLSKVKKTIVDAPADALLSAALREEPTVGQSPREANHDDPRGKP